MYDNSYLPSVKHFNITQFSILQKSVGIRDCSLQKQIVRLRSFAGKKPVF